MKNLQKIGALLLCLLLLIGATACAGMKALAHVQFCEGVEVIGDYAFERCINLQEISTPASLRIIGQAAFRDANLSRVTMKDGVLCIMSDAFSHCNAAERFRINLPSTVIYCSPQFYSPDMEANMCVYLEKGSYTDRAGIIPAKCVVYDIK